MSGMDLKPYKRMVKYFWDPEPRNDDASNAPIWCLGRRYDPRQKPKAIETNQTTPSPEPALHRATPPQDDGDSEPGIATVNGVETKTPENGSVSWPNEFLEDFESRFWFTYRSNFPAIQKSANAGSMSLSVRLRSQILDHGSFTSDTGWGCMIRSGQSLLANSLAVLRLGRDWRRGTLRDEERRLIALFADEVEAPFSIQRFVEHGAEACGKHPGEWFGPSATARCIQALSESDLGEELRVYLTSDGGDIYEDRFLKHATATEGKFTPTLILVGIRLGIDRVTPAYHTALQKTLEMPQSVGIAGGSPSSSHYFVGHQGDKFFFLDPHQTRQALPRREKASDYLDEEVDSCHTRRLRRLPIEDMDPSMLMGFLIRDLDEWKTWRQAINDVPGKPVVHISDVDRDLHGPGSERQSAVDDVETFDDDQDNDMK